MSTPPGEAPRRVAVLAALSLLYAAQGIPFGFASDYLIVTLRHAGLSRTALAAFGFLQLPWQLKALWASVADHPRVRPRARAALLALQLALAAVMASYAFVQGPPALAPWCALTAVAAFVAATQDVFVDAFAVRTLTAHERGWGNSAQVAGYRVGMLLGGGGMLTLAGWLGVRAMLLACGALIALAALGAFALRDDEPAPDAAPSHVAPRTSARAHFAELGAVLRHVAHPATRTVALVAVTYKLGIHAAAGLIKPMLVDAGWTNTHIGGLAVSLGAACAIAGSLAGAALHRWLGERRALVTGAALHALAVLPLVAASTLGCPRALTTAAIGAEHFASGAGTTVLFAALMTATQRERAALHYTVLTSFNALAIGLGGLLGAALGDRLGVTAAYLFATAACIAPLPLLGRWAEHAAHSARAEYAR